MTKTTQRRVASSLITRHGSRALHTAATRIGFAIVKRHPKARDWWIAVACDIEEQIAEKERLSGIIS